MSLRRTRLAIAVAIAVAITVAAALPPLSAVAADAPAGPPSVTHDVLADVGIGVKDIEASSKFYQDVLGMKVLRRFDLGYITEIVLGIPGDSGANVVLMNWPGDKTRRYDGNDVKIVFYVADPAAVLARIKAHGGKVDREAAPIAALNGRVVGLGRDLDNYVVELLAR